MARAAQWAASTAASAEARLGQTRQGVNSPLDGDEPPIDVAAQDFRSVWYVRRKVPGTTRALRQRGGASEGVLAISRHDRFPRSSAFNRIARRLQCSSTRRDRRPGTLRGIGALGLTNT